MGVVNTEEGMFWATGIDTSGLEVDAKKMQQIISEITENTGKSVDRMKANLNESMRAQQSAINKLELELAKLEDAYAKTGKVGYHTPEYTAQRKKEKQAIAEVRAELEGEKVDLADRKQVYELLGGKISSVQTRMTSLRNEMAAMRAQGLENTKEYREMGGALAELGKIYQQVKVEQQGLVKGSSFQGLLGGLNGLAGVFSAGAGAMGLLNAKSEDYAKIQARVQSMIAITVGLQSAYNALNETGAFRVQIFSKAVDLLNTKLKINIGLSKLLVTSGIGLLLAGITALVVVYDKWKKKQEENNKLQKEFQELQKAGYAAAQSEIVKLQELERTAKNLNEPTKKRLDALKKLNTLMPEYNGHLDKETGKLVANKDALLEYVKALASMEVAKQLAIKNAEDTVKLLESEQREAEVVTGKRKAPVKHTAYVPVVGVSTSGYVVNGEPSEEAMKKAEQADRDAYAKSEQDSRKLIKQGIKKREDLMKELMPKGITTPSDLSGGGGSGTGTSSAIPENLSLGIAENYLKLEAEKIRIMKDGKEKRLKLSEQEWKEEITRLDKEHEERLKKYKEQGAVMPEEEIKIYSDRKETAGKAKDKRDADIEKEFKKELEDIYKDLGDVFLSEEERKKKAVKERFEEERKLAKERFEGGSMTKDEYEILTVKINEAEVLEQYDRILKSLNDFKQQEKDITVKWDNLIADAVESGDTDLLARLEKGKSKALSELNSQMLMQSESWLRLFQNLNTLTTAELENLVASIEEQINSGALNLEPADLQALMDKLEQAQGKLASKQPFKELGKSIEAYKKSLQSLKKAEADGLTGEALDKYKQDVQNAAERVKRSITAIKNAYEQISDVMKAAADFVGMVDEGLGETINNALNLGDTVMTLGEVVTSAVTSFAAGMSAMETASVILLIIKAVILAVMAAIALFNNDKKLKKAIKESEDAVKDLEYAYQKLEKAIEKAFSTDKVKLIEQQNENLKRQNKDLQDAIATENTRGKKKDEDANKERLRKIEENNEKIKENSKEAVIEAMTGKDIMSAIDEFSSAYADAWAKNEDATKRSADVIKNTVKSGLMEWLKKELEGDIKNIQGKIADYLKDGIITDAEQAELDRLQAELDRKAEAKRKQSGFDKYNIDDQTGVTGELRAEMTEKTGSQLVGLWNMTAMDIRAIKEYFDKNPINGFEKETAEILNTLHSIDRNTKDTADNTDGLIDELEEMNDKLDEIKNNTKNNNSRG